MTAASKPQVNGPLNDTKVSVKLVVAEIDAPVFHLYALNPAEIQLVKGASA